MLNTQSLDIRRIGELKHSTNVLEGKISHIFGSLEGVGEEALKINFIEG